MYFLPFKLFTAILNVTILVNKIVNFLKKKKNKNDNNDSNNQNLSENKINKVDV